MKRSDFTSGWEFERDGGAFQPVIVPHDAMLGNRRGPDAPGGSASGYFFGGSYRYRKAFGLTPEQADGTLLLEFEGLYRDASVAVNGVQLEVPPYGFVPFFLDITGVAVAGANEVDVSIDTTGQPDCRWYSGAGIHRPVWLWEGGAARIQPEGVRVTTLSADPARIRVDVDAIGGVPVAGIFGPDGALVAEARGDRVEIELDGAQLWSAEHPVLYRCRVELRDGPEGAVLDAAETAFGIRALAWSPRGLFVNGRETLLRGGCIHCDNGILGAASWPAAERRRIALLKGAGFNAVRVAHNPAPASLLSACDELGMYVMDETWDMWYMRKSTHDYARHFLDWCDFDLRRLVARDFNHPSVIMYSIGNELSEPTAHEGVELERTLVDFLHSLDPTRPVTCGFNLTLMVMERAGRGWYASGEGVAEAAQGAPSASAGEGGKPRGSLMFNMVAQASGTGMTYLANVPGADALVSPALDALDIAGYNYAAARYRVDARKHPGRIIVGSETFPHELARNWRLVRELPGVIGDFMWAAWDYLGEAGAGAWAYTPEEAGFSKPWPWLLAGSGALDIFGEAGAPAALAGAVWGALDGPSIQVRPVNRMGGRTYKATWRGSDAVPSWSWRGCEGMPAQVEVYSARARSIRLQLDGQVVGCARVRGFVARFKVEYRPGVLEAVELDGRGNELGRSRLVSASGELGVRAVAEKAEVPAGSIAYVSVSIAGCNGVADSNTDVLVAASVEGGDLLAFGSAKPAPVESYLDGAFTTYRGRAQAVMYRSSPGIATLTVRADGFGESSAAVAFV